MVFFYLVLILHFCCFQSFKELVSVFVETDCKVTTFFWIDKIFQKKYLFFLFKLLLFNSQATSLDCGCKVTAFSENTKIFLIFFANFFVTRYIWMRKILIHYNSCGFLCHFLLLFGLFSLSKTCYRTWFFQDFGFFCVFSKFYRLLNRYTTLGTKKYRWIENRDYRNYRNYKKSIGVQQKSTTFFVFSKKSNYCESF